VQDRSRIAQAEPGERGQNPQPGRQHAGGRHGAGVDQVLQCVAAGVSDALQFFEVFRPLALVVISEGRGGASCASSRYVPWRSRSPSEFSGHDGVSAETVRRRRATPRAHRPHARPGFWPVAPARPGHREAGPASRRRPGNPAWPYGVRSGLALCPLTVAGAAHDTATIRLPTDTTGLGRRARSSSGWLGEYLVQDLGALLGQGHEAAVVAGNSRPAARGQPVQPSQVRSAA
jgi:hypothetical protein